MGTTIGATVVGLTALAAAWPKVSAYLGNRKASTLPHDAVKTLIDYFTAKGCKDGVSASVNVGKLLYEECSEHVNNLPK